MPAKYCDQCGSQLGLGHHFDCPVAKSISFMLAQQQQQNTTPQFVTQPFYICIQTTQGKHYLPYTPEHYREIYDALRKKRDLEIAQSLKPLLILFKHIVAVYVLSPKLVDAYREIEQKLYHLREEI